MFKGNRLSRICLLGTVLHSYTVLPEITEPAAWSIIFLLGSLEAVMRKVPHMGATADGSPFAEKNQTM